MFGQTLVEYFGHIISEGFVKPDPNKIYAMDSWSKPKTIRQLRAFIDLTEYYRIFVRGYAGIAAPLTDLLHKDSFVWTHTMQRTFEALKIAMSSAPVLHCLISPRVCR